MTSSTSCTTSSRARRPPNVPTGSRSRATTRSAPGMSPPRSPPAPRGRSRAGRSRSRTTSPSPASDDERIARGGGFRPQPRRDRRRAAACRRGDDRRQELSARICAARVPASPRPPGRCATRGTPRAKRADHPVAAPHSSPPVRSTWPSAATKADRSGSRRRCAASSGTKPTHGLVPYTGAFPIERTIDHLGPMTRTVADAALLLTVLAGPDGRDPRQPAEMAAVDYRAALTGDVAGLRVGRRHRGLRAARLAAGGGRPGPVGGGAASPRSAAP